MILQAATGTAGTTTGFWDVFPPAPFPAALAAAVAAFLHLFKSRADERGRARVLFAEAYEWYAAYKEMPYAIRRRWVDDPAAERIRLSETVREIQARLGHFKTWTALENVHVGAAYATCSESSAGSPGRPCTTCGTGPARTPTAR